MRCNTIAALRKPIADDKKDLADDTLNKLRNSQSDIQKTLSITLGYGIILWAAGQYRANSRCLSSYTAKIDFVKRHRAT